RDIRRRLAVGRPVVIVVRNVALVPLALALLLEACAAPTPYAPTTINPLRVPIEPVNLTGAFSCTAYNEGKLPAIVWRQIPFRQEGDRLIGIYNFKDSFGYRDSVVFNGTISGGTARVTVTAVRSDGSSNFTADMAGAPSAMTGQMMLGTSQ